MTIIAPLTIQVVCVFSELYVSELISYQKYY